MAWRPARAIASLKAEVLSAYPGTTCWIKGDDAHSSRASDHNPLKPPKEPIVCGIDIVGKEQAKATFDAIVRERPPRVKYAIHGGKIVSSTYEPWAVRTYGGANPHSNHCHVSVGRGPDGKSTRPDLYDDGSPWGLYEEEDMTELIKILQQMLKDGGKYDGEIDGVWGPVSEAAMKAFAKDAVYDALNKKAGDARYVRKNVPTKLSQ